MATYAVTNTQDTDTGLTPAPADIAGSLRAALDAANAANGGNIAFALPANSTIALLNSLPAVVGATTIDFSGAPGLTITAASGGSTAPPYGGLFDTGVLTLAGTLQGDANSGPLLILNATGVATLAAGAALIGNTTAVSYPTILDTGVSLTLSANVRVSAVASNAVAVTQQSGAVANQTVTIAGGAVLSDSASGAPTLYVSGGAQGALVTNSGTITSSAGNAYYAQSGASTNTSTLVNTASGVISDSSTIGNAAVNLGGAAALQNAGTITDTGNANAVYVTGTSVVANSGTMSSAGGSAYYSAGSSTLINSGTISSSASNAYYAFNAGDGSVNGSSLTNTAQGVLTAAGSLTSVNFGGAVTVNNAGLVSNTGTGNALLDQGVGAVVNSGVIRAATGTAYYDTAASTLTNTSAGTITSAGSTSVRLLADGGALVNAGAVTNTYSGGGTAQTIQMTGASTLANSGTVSETNASGYAIGVSGGGETITSTGVIRSAGSYAINVFGGGSAATTITLAAGSQTVGSVGGSQAGPLAVTLAGALTGNLYGSASSADAVTLVNGLSFTGVVNLGGGGDTLTLDGTAGSSTLVGTNVQNAVALAKTGAGTWVLSGAGANYTGVALNGGVLELTAPNAAGQGAITFGAGSQTLRLDLTSGANFVLPNTLSGFGVEDLIDIRNATVTAASATGDTLTLTTSAGTTATVTFASGTLAGKTVATGTDNAGGSYVTVGAALAPPAVAPGQAANLDSSNSAVVNGDVTDNGTAQIGGATPITYTGAISGAGSVAVSGGTVAFTGASTYTGATTVTAGTLLVNGSIASSPVTVGSGGVLGGSGTTGAVTAASGATVSPGNSPGVLSTTGDLTLAAGSAIKEEIGGLVNAPGATTFDQIKVTGAVNLNGATLNAVLYGGFTPAVTGSAPIVIIDNDGTDAVVGTFAGLPEGSVFVVNGQQVKISYVGGTGNDVTLQFVGPYGSPVSVTAPSQTASQAAGYAVQTGNLLRASSADAGLANPASPIYAQAQAEAQIAAKLDAGQIGPQDAQAQLFHLVDGTTSVAEISYAFFTGRTPTAAGLNYLVNSPANPTDLNDAYYAQFTTENRYINFGVNLATGAGAGAAAFQAAYGSLSLSDATTKAYQAVFGITPTADKVAAILNAQVSNGLGGTETRAQYLADISGGSTIAQKAAVVGFLLADSVKEGFGTYQQADQHFLQDLAHGTAAFNVDLLAAYTQAPSLVGQPVVDPALGR